MRVVTIVIVVRKFFDRFFCRLVCAISWKDVTDLERLQKAIEYDPDHKDLCFVKVTLLKLLLFASSSAPLSSKEKKKYYPNEMNSANALSSSLSSSRSKDANAIPLAPTQAYGGNDALDYPAQ